MPYSLYVTTLYSLYVTTPYSLYVTTPYSLNVTTAVHSMLIPIFLLILIRRLI